MELKFSHARCLAFNQRATRLAHPECLLDSVREARHFKSSANATMFSSAASSIFTEVQVLCDLTLVSRSCTACGHRMVHRKWNETKQQPSLLHGPAVPGSSLVSFHFLWEILCPQAVDGAVKIEDYFISNRRLPGIE